MWHVRNRGPTHVDRKQLPFRRIWRLGRRSRPQPRADVGLSSTTAIVPRRGGFAFSEACGQLARPIIPQLDLNVHRRIGIRIELDLGACGDHPQRIDQIA